MCFFILGPFFRVYDTELIVVRSAFTIQSQSQLPELVLSSIFALCCSGYIAVTEFLELQMLFWLPLVWQEYNEKLLYVYQISRKDSLTPQNLENTFIFGSPPNTSQTFSCHLFIYEQTLQFNGLASQSSIMSQLIWILLLMHIIKCSLRRWIYFILRFSN